MGLSFRAKLLLSHVALVAAVIVLALLELDRQLSSDLERQLDLRLEEQARGAAPWVGEGGRRHPDKLASRIASVVGAEVTIFDGQLRVAGDSHPGSREDANLVEVIAAQQGQVGRATRRLAASGDEMHYVAVSAGGDMVLRLAAPLSGINRTVQAMRARLLFASGLALVAALALGFFASRVAARPLREMTESAAELARGHYDIALRATSPDEFGVLSRALQTLARELKLKISDLVTERDRLSAILAGMAEGVLVFDAERHVQVANPAARDILSRTDELVGKTLEEAHVDPALCQVIYEAASESHGGERELDSRGRSLSVYVRTLTDAGGTGFVTVLRDMTRLRRLLAMRRDFVANVSHELRTPVAAIQGYAETLLSGSRDEKTSRDFLGVIHRQAQRLGRLVQELLTLSELEARPERASLERVDLGELAKHVLEAVRDRAVSNAVTLEAHASGNVVADSAGLEQALLNLVDNAIKYGKPGGLVAIRTRELDGRVMIAVEDNGPGIAPQHLPRLFERFYRIDAARSRELGGTGLGLAIVKHLVEAMGGTVGVESSLGAGSTFRIELPKRA